MPDRRRCLVKAALALVGACAVACGAAGVSRAGELPTLYVNYAINCTFTITDDSGAAVTSIPPGSYQVEVQTPTEFALVEIDGTDDTACKGAVAFQLTGPGVDVTTTLSDGDANYALLSATFAPSSTYVAVDNTNPSSQVSFGTTASGTPVAPAAPVDPSAASGASGTSSSSDVVGTSSPPVALLPLRGTLEATVSAAGKLALTFEGKNVSTLVAGRYTISVRSQHRKTSFIIQEINDPAVVLAGPSLGTTREVTLTIHAGQWFFYPTFVGKKAYFIVIS